MLDKIIEFYSDEEIIIADGFDEAIIGIEASSMRVIYSTSKCIDILMRDMSEEDAIEHFGYNVSGAYIGEKTPIFCEDNFEKDYRSPYCPVCSGCGHDGCCSPLNCDPSDPMCHYSETYTEDLKLGYSSFVKFWDLLEENNWFGKKEEFMKLYDEQLDERHKVNESL